MLTSSHRYLSKHAEMGIKHTCSAYVWRLFGWDVCYFSPPSCSTKRKFSTWVFGMVVSCCDAIGNVSVTSLWSHPRTHPCILWRSKLRNTYCTLDVAKGRFNIFVIKRKIGSCQSFVGPFLKHASVLQRGIAIWLAVRLFLRLMNNHQARFLELLQNTYSGLS